MSALCNSKFSGELKSSGQRTLWFLRKMTLCVFKKENERVAGEGVFYNASDNRN